MAAKVPPEMAEKIEEYRAERGLNTSQAMREVMEEGFDSMEEGNKVTLPITLMWIGSVVLATTTFDIEVLVTSGAFLGGLLMAVGFALSRPEFGGFLERLHRDRGASE